MSEKSQIITWILAVLLISAVITLAANAEEVVASGTCGKDLIWEIVGNILTISSIAQWTIMKRAPHLGIPIRIQLRFLIFRKVLPHWEATPSLTVIDMDVKLEYYHLQQ